MEHIAKKKKKKKRVRNHEEETWAGGILYSACLSSNKHWDQGQETASGIATAHLKKKKMFPLGLETKGCKKKKPTARTGNIAIPH